MGERKQNAVKTVGIVMVIMLVGKVIGLLRDILGAGYLGGTSIEAEAFNMASSIPNEFLDFAFASAISASFIPVFNGYLKRKGKKEAFGLAHNFITIILGLSALFTVLAMWFAPQIVSVLGYGYSAEKQAMTVQLLQMMLPTIVLTAVAFSITGLLQSLDEFNVPAAMSIVSNLVIILYYIFFMNRFGVYGLAVAYLLGWATQVLVQLPSLSRKGYRFRFHLDLKDPGIREVGRLVIPVMISSWVQPVNSQVNRSAVSVVDGGVSALRYANSLYAVITGVFILSIANVIFPKLSRDSAGQDDKAFGNTMGATLRVLLFLLLPMMAGIIILAKPIVSVMYERGAFDSYTTGLTAQALMLFATGMLGFGAQTILSRGFYAEKDGKTPLITGLIAIAMNGALSFGLVGPMGIGGPALATAVSMNATALIMFMMMYRRNRHIWNRKVGLDAVKMLFLAVSMGFVIWALQFVLVSFGGGFVVKFMKLAVSVGVGVLWYMGLAYVFRIPEARQGWSMVTQVVKRKKDHDL